MELKDYIRTIPDFPEKGVLFRDITTVLQNPEALQESIKLIKNELDDLDFDLVVGPESRGFIFGVPTAFATKKGFVPVRKPGKLPADVYKKEYALEYGTSTLEIHTDAIKKGQRVVVVDDLLATGGTCKALAELVEECGGIVAKMVFFIELEDLKGRDILDKYDVRSIIKY